ncbi:MAG: hypothetical protein QM731_20630 [Chitinophagaceae bacterium]
MKTILKQLFFDKELVKNIKATKAQPELLYIELMNGRITLQEYIAAL